MATCQEPATLFRYVTAENSKKKTTITTPIEQNDSNTQRPSRKHNLWLQEASQLPENLMRQPLRARYVEGAPLKVCPSDRLDSR
jgi:hypothetical protein